MGERVPPHRLVDVDVMDKEGNEVAEEKMELKKHVVIHGQLRDLAVLQWNHRLRGQWRAGHARPRTIPDEGETRHENRSGEKKVRIQGPGDP